VGSRRLLYEDNYFETYNKANVTLVDVRSSPIEEITSTGLRTQDGEYELDMIVCATGFDSGTGAMLGIDPVGKFSVKLSEEWATGPQTYLGVMIETFPNLFMLAGPGSPSIRSSVIVSIEQHVEWISELLNYMQDQSFETVEPTAEAQNDWTAYVADVAASTLLVRGNNQYVGANIPGKPRVYTSYVGGVGKYRTICDDVKSNGYEGFIFKKGDASFVSSLNWSGTHSESKEAHVI